MASNFPLTANQFDFDVCVCGLRPQCATYFTTWSKIALILAVFCGIFVHRVLSFRYLFSSKMFTMLCFENSSIVESGFRIEVPIFRVCQGKLKHFSNKFIFSDFLCMDRNFWSLAVFRYVRTGALPEIRTNQRLRCFSN